MHRSNFASTTPFLRRVGTIVLAASLAAPVSATRAGAASSPPREHAAAFAAGELIVRAADGAALHDVAAALAAHGAAVRTHHPDLGVALVDVPEGEERRIAARLAAEAAVEYAETNTAVRVAGLTPDEPGWDLQWGPRQVEAPEAWGLHPGTFVGNQGSEATGVPVAVVDTGVFAGHPDLDDGRVRTELGANCVNADWVCGPGDTDDEFGHGTSIAGVISANTDNGVGVAGVAFASPLIPVRIFDGAGNATALGAANGILWAVQHGAKVVNVSFVADEENATLCEAVRTATVDYDAVVTAPAGNFSTDAPVRYPGACEHALAVSGTTVEAGVEKLASFSNWGEHVFVAAPGESIVSTAPYGGHADGYTDPSGYLAVSGTSMATPHVASVAALLASRGTSGTTSARAIAERIAETADKIGTFAYTSSAPAQTIACAGGHNTVFGYGRVNARRALQVATTDAPFRLGVVPVASEVAPGESASYDVEVEWQGGALPGPVTLSVAGLPDGTTATWSANPVTDASTLTISGTDAIPRGRHEFDVTGADGAVTASAPASLCTPDFSLSASPESRWLMQGASRQFSLVIDRAVGAGDVDLAVVDAPPGVTVDFDPEQTAERSTLTVTTSASTPTGAHLLTLRGTGAGLERTTAVAIVVDEPRTEARRYVGPGGDFVLHCELSWAGACFEIQGNETVVDVTVSDDTGVAVGGVLEFATGWDSPITTIPFCGSPQRQTVPQGISLVIVRFRATEAPSNCGPATMGTVTAAFN